MLDRMLYGKWEPPFWAGREIRDQWDSRRFRHIAREIAQVEAILASNVTEYWLAGTPQEEWEWRTDFPNLAPPFERFWIETRAIGRIVSGKTVQQFTPALRGWGAYVKARELRNAAGLRRGWVEHFLLIGERTSQGRFVPIGERRFILDATGQVAEASDGGPAITDAHLTRSGEFLELSKHLVSLLCMPLALAICFMHCRNVELVSRDPDEKLSRQHRRKHGRPLLRYHILGIEPVRRVLADEGDAEEVGLRRALHICRGHFKDYRQRGLFGKHRGIYWWSDFVRGDVTTGLVVKDYAVGSPQDNT
jgi:hypothetical protein